MNQPYQSSDHPKTRQPGQQWYQHTSQRDTPSSEAQQSTQQGSAAYREGYRAQERVTPPAAQEAGPTDRLYEEPQATYPEMTQEQK